MKKRRRRKRNKLIIDRLSHIDHPIIISFVIVVVVCLFVYLFILYYEVSLS